MSKLITRTALDLVTKYLSRYPAVHVLGPRQSGKTSLSRQLSNYYFDLEDPIQLERVKLDWPEIVSSEALVVFDEAQAWPELFNRLRGAIDSDRQRNGRFLILGSISVYLIKEITQSLAGRIAHVPLTGFTYEEIAPYKALTDLWLYGGFPDGGILNPQDYPTWQKNYIHNLIYVDLPAWGCPARATQTQRLLYMLAAVHGQQWNASALSKSLGINYQTVNQYVDYLEGAFIIRKLNPYFSNIKKRIVKSPKMYIRDSGILHALLGVPNYGTLLNQPWVGASWEGFVIESILNHLDQKGIHYTAYYLRTHNQGEIDLILNLGSQIWAIEIKLSKEADYGALKKLNQLALTINANRTFVISLCPEIRWDEKTGSLCPLPEFLELLNIFT